MNKRKLKGFGDNDISIMLRICAEMADYGEYNRLGWRLADLLGDLKEAGIDEMGITSFTGKGYMIIDRKELYNYE